MDFYVVDKNYVQYLKDFEEKYNGFSHVPNIHYDTRDKFLCGPVVEINGIKYYVALSSYKKHQEGNILITIPKDRDRIKGSLRFNYMIPVPDQCLEKLVIKSVDDDRYRKLLNKEYSFCVKNANRINKKAQKIYDCVVNNKNDKIVENSCDFKLLEQAMQEYIIKEDKVTDEPEKAPGAPDDGT